MQVGGDPTQLLLLSAALQNSLTAGLCFCFDTFEVLLFIQLCSDPT